MKIKWRRKMSGLYRAEADGGRWIIHRHEGGAYRALRFSDDRGMLTELAVYGTFRGAARFAEELEAGRG